MSEIIDVQQIEANLIATSTIPSSRDYWLVRTAGGAYYTSFRQFNYIGLGHNEISLGALNAIIRKAGKNEKLAYKLIWEFCHALYRDSEETRPGFIASQIFKFVYHIKKGDVVIIPSDNSEVVAIGYVADDVLIPVTVADLKRTECTFNKRKSVVWSKFIRRENLDPYLYRVFTAHQAINNITFGYGDLIERTLRNFYIKDGVANLILDVEVSKEEGINAKKLFELGYYLLDYTSDYIAKYKLPLNIDDLEVKINLNSSGKIQFLTKKTGLIVFVVSLITLSVAGGGLKFNYKEFNLDLSTRGLLKTISDFENEVSQRDATEQIVKQQLDSLKIKSPDDAIKLLEQLGKNNNSSK